MAIGTQVEFEQTENFPFLPKYDPFQLNFRIQLGYLDIQPRASMAQTTAQQLSNNSYFPPPGGSLGESFVNNDQMKKMKSAGLQQTTNGLAPGLMEPGGAPFCTFVTGAIVASDQHPYYDLIKAPPSENPVTQTTANFSLSTPLIQRNDYLASQSPIAKQFNKLGSAFIPSTTKTSDAVAGLELESSTTYNIWQVDNINGDYFDLEKFLGYVPKTGTQSRNLQPYAQTWSFMDSAAVQVYASNSQVSLTRKYPISQDYAHNEGVKYCIYTSYEGSENQLVAKDINLSSQDFVKPDGTMEPDAGRQNAVGFTFVMKIAAANTVPVGEQDGVVITEPRMLISWGDLDQENEQPAPKTKKSDDIIKVYTLEISGREDRPSRIYFNISAKEIMDSNTDPNHNFVELPELKLFEDKNKNSVKKAVGDFVLTVYYSGPYMYIGTGKDRSKWHTVGPPTLNVLNSTNVPIPVPCRHYLHDKSKINITAQYMNFTFMYGPPLFNPHDDQNIPGLAANYDGSANSYNMINSQVQVAVDSDVTDEQLQQDYQTMFDQFMESRKWNTFQSFNLNEEKDEEDLVGGASAYTDVRAVNPKFNNIVQIPPYSGKDYNKIVKYKTTFPQDLGGHTYTKQFAQKFPDPYITESYVEYLPVAEEVLTTALTALTIQKNVDQETITSLTSTLNCTFVNLNKSDVGNEILQFIRQNVCVIKISAGYGNDLHVYFEGMIQEVKVTEELDRSTFQVSAKDLMSALFIDENTCIISRNQMLFVGMKYRSIINSLVESTEMRNHFQYDLSPTLYDYITKHNIPRSFDSFSVQDLATLAVDAYSESKNYFSVLRNICILSIQTTQNSNSGQYSSFDIPILHWYAGDDRNGNINGIIMSTRKQLKDKDLFFLRKGSFTQEDISDIDYLHGYLTGTAKLVSESTTNNLSALGLMRFQNYNNTYNSVFRKNTKAFDKRGLRSKGYVGYNRIVMFDNPSADQGANVYVEQTLLPNPTEAQKFIDRWMYALYENVYENVSLASYVTKPLKEYGFFRVCVESDDIEIPEDYLFNSVVYNFDIDRNLIVAEVTGSKKPYMSL